MRLYDLPRSPWCQKVRVALAEKGLAFERHIVLPGQEYEDWYAALDPAARVPVLTDKDLVVRGATVIGEYLEEAYPDRPLLPASPEARAAVRMIVALVDEIVGPALDDLFFALRIEAEEEGEPAVRAEIEDEVAEALALVEGELEADSVFAVGESFTLADAALAPFVIGLVDELELGGALEALPRLAAYRHRIEGRPSVAAVRQAWAEWREMAEGLAG